MTQRTLTPAIAPILGLAVAPLAHAQDSQPDLPASRILSVCPVDAPAGQITSFAAGETAPVAETTAASAAGQVITATASVTGSYANTHYVRINGSTLPIIGIVGAAITVEGALPAIANGDLIEIVPLPTLDLIFGAANKLGLTQNSSPTAADNILAIIDGTFRTFFFSPSLVGGGQWNEVGGGSDIGSSVVFPPDTGFWINRGSGIGLVLPQGTVQPCDASRSIAINEGFGFYSNPFQETVTLDDSGLGAVLESNSSPTAADNVLLEIGGTIRTFFFSPSLVGGGQWNEVGGASNVGETISIEKGKAFLVNRRGTGTVSVTLNNQ